MAEVDTFVPVMVDVSDLKPHPRNYQQHPEIQLRHIISSIETHGFYRNVVIARDNTILAGHGVTEAAMRMGLTQVPVIKMDIDPNDPRAIKLLTGDNEISNLAVVNDRMLTELLREVMGTEALDLSGTGFDADQLANLLMITRPLSEIKDSNQAGEWLGMPDWDVASAALRLIVSFENEEDRQEFAKRLGYAFTEKTKSVWYPDKRKDDPASVGFEG